MCVSVCMCVCVCVYKESHAYLVSVYKYMSIKTHSYRCVCIKMNTCIYMYVCVYVFRLIWLGFMASHCCCLMLNPVHTYILNIYDL